MTQTLYWQFKFLINNSWRNKLYVQGKVFHVCLFSIVWISIAIPSIWKVTVLTCQRVTLKYHNSTNAIEIKAKLCFKKEKIWGFFFYHFIRFSFRWSRRGRRCFTNAVSWILNKFPIWMDTNFPSLWKDSNQTNKQTFQKFE